MKFLIHGLLSLILLTLPCMRDNDRAQSSATLCRDRKAHSYINKKNQSPNAWRGITPLHSNRKEVEAVLGKPKRWIGAQSIYESDCETVNVLYSQGSCELSGGEHWKVPIGTVKWLEVAPATKLFVKDLKLDPSRYVRQQSHPENWVEYRSVEDGIRVRAMLDGKEESVQLFTYEPRKQDKDLRCERP